MLAGSTVFAADYDMTQENISAEEVVLSEEEAISEEAESEEGALETEETLETAEGTEETPETVEGTKETPETAEGTEETPETVEETEETSEDTEETEESNPEEGTAEDTGSGSLDGTDDEKDSEESAPEYVEEVEGSNSDGETTDNTEMESSDEADDSASDEIADEVADSDESAEPPLLEETDLSVELAADAVVKCPSFVVKGVFNGRQVTFNSDYAGARIYYSTTTSNITLNDASVLSGESVMFNSFYGTVYAKVYVDGVWSGSARLILKIPTVNMPTISLSGDKIKITTTTPNCYISYTTDGSTPSETNGTKVYGSTLLIPRTVGTVKAVALRSCFTNSGVATMKIKPAPPAFAVQGVFGGRNVTFSSTDPGAKIYYSTTTSNITTSDLAVANGGTKLFENYYGTIYAKSYCNGEWSNPAKLILKIPVVNAPTITLKSNVATIATTTPLCYIVYTTDGTTPSLTNGTRVYGGNASKITVTVPVGTTIKAMAIRSCFTNSSIVSKTVPIPSGYSVSEAIPISLNQFYNKAWTKSTYQYDHYTKFTLEEDGLILLNMTKPVDSKGEEGNLTLELYDVKGSLIWSTNTKYANKVPDDWKYFVGLGAGTYYLNITPNFYITSGSVSTLYGVFYAPSDYCEKEPNSGMSTATKLEPNQYYEAFWGATGDKFDYFTFTMDRNNNARIYITNYDEISATTTLIDLISDAGQTNISYRMKYDSSEGEYYYDLSGLSAGTYYIKIYNYSGYYGTIDYEIAFCN